MAQVTWSATALRQLTEIGDRIARDSPEHGVKVVLGIYDRSGILADHPLIGRKVPEIPEFDMREIIYESYRIVYVTDGALVEIAAVTHGSRDMRPFMLSVLHGQN